MDANEHFLVTPCGSGKKLEYCITRAKTNALVGYVEINSEGELIPQGRLKIAPNGEVKTSSISIIDEVFPYLKRKDLAQKYVQKITVQKI